MQFGNERKPIRFFMEKHPTEHASLNINNRELYDIIIRKISEVDSQNRRLLSISDAIRKSSFISETNVNSIIEGFEQEIRDAFEDIVKFLRENFVLMHKKLKAVNNRLDDLMHTPLKHKRSEPKCSWHIAYIEILQSRLKEYEENELYLRQVINESTKARDLSQIEFSKKALPNFFKQINQNKSNSLTKESKEKRNKLADKILTKISSLKFFPSKSQAVIPKPFNTSNKKREKRSGIAEVIQESNESSSFDRCTKDSKQRYATQGDATECENNEEYDLPNKH